MLNGTHTNTLKDSIERWSSTQPHCGLVGYDNI